MLSANQENIKKENEIYQEQVRQAKWTFKISITFDVTRAAITIFSALCLMTGRMPSEVGGAAAVANYLFNAASVRCAQSAKEANDRLDISTRRMIDKSRR